MKKGVSQIATKTNGYAKSTWLFACLAISLSSCKKENFTIVNLNNNRITTLGHSGMGVGRVYPTDTYESVLNCLATGADGTEINVQLTKDNVLVAFHDENLTVATNLEGLINSHTWAELENAHYDTYPYMQFSILNYDNFFQSSAIPKIIFSPSIVSCLTVVTGSFFFRIIPQH